MRAFSTIARKRKSDESSGTMLIFKIVGDGLLEKDHSVALFICGDFYALKEIIKDSVKYEQEINNVTIPVPRDAHPAKFLSKDLLTKRVRVMDSEILGMAKFIQNNVEISGSVCLYPVHFHEPKRSRSVRIKFVWQHAHILESRFFVTD